VTWNPAHPVFVQSRRTPDRLALAADGVELTYVELARRAGRLAGALGERGLGHGSRIGILGTRSLVAVEAVLGVAWAGATYVPLGVTWPEPRLLSVLSQVGLDAVIVDGRGQALLTPAVRAAVKQLLPDLASLPDIVAVSEPAPMAAEDLSYVIFTSGTTGVPKGVMVPAAAVAAYLAALGARKAMAPEDRASQFTELTFDPSLGEIFVPWHTGASLHIVPAISQVSPARFIRERQLTIWGSTPAAIAWMRDTRSLQPGAFPLLRYTSFGGEPLPLAAVRAWQAAAPNSVVDNLYGPTEATVDCVGQLVAPGETPVVTPERGVLAIGTPHAGTELAVLGPDLRPVPAGAVGELAIAGRQLSLGYLGAPDVTAERFPTIEGKRWYLTGDLALRDAAGLFHHLGRVDNQVKIHGHRVELEDIEAQVRIVAGVDQVAAVAWPVEDGVARAIVCFVAGSATPAARIREALRGRLPPHMVPAEIRAVPALPVNASNKLDRRALIASLEAGTA
jgi:D-alanine--poly(phosphoribitol) ligase subunit 1